MDANCLDYSQFESVEDLYSSGLITEKKKEEPKEEPKEEGKKKGKEDGKEEEEEGKEETKEKDDPEEPEKVIQTDNKIPVIYANLRPKENTNIFKHILVFTNDRSTEHNKTLHNIWEAVKELPKSIRPELHVFVAAEMSLEEDESKITIWDDKSLFVIDKEESNLNTLVFSRLGVQDEDLCEHIVQLLQDRGFLVLNPVKYSALACDKYQSACLFEKGEIPQPRFCLMDKPILYDQDDYERQIQRIYPEYSSENPGPTEDNEVVIKILDGHGGTGVFCSTLKQMTAILQAIFAIDPERKLLIQKKEEADGGDIRVHVLTLREKQVILAAMKRVKLGKGDFRSNVSLGAQAEPVKLTPEQEQIALKTAMISKLPWCAVDIMPLKKGSNPELGDNVVLEINASPGTDGISQVIGINFIHILLNELDDPSKFMLQDKNAGFLETVTLKFAEDFSMDFLAKLDTGCSVSASTVEVGEYKEEDGHVHFTLKGHDLEFPIVDHVVARAGEVNYKRPVIIIPELTCGLRKVKNARMALVESRASKTTNLLLNRDTIGILGYVVHPTTAHILTPEIQKIEIK